MTLNVATILTAKVFHLRDKRVEFQQEFWCFFSEVFVNLEVSKPRLRDQVLKLLALQVHSHLHHRFIHLALLCLELGTGVINLLNKLVTDKFVVHRLKFMCHVLGIRHDWVIFHEFHQISALCRLGCQRHLE